MNITHVEDMKCSRCERGNKAETQLMAMLPGPAALVQRQQHEWIEVDGTGPARPQ